MASANDGVKGRVPEVGEYVRMIGTLVAVEEVVPPPPPKEVDYIFEDSEARVEVLANGHKIDDGPTINDFYGKGTSVETAIEEAEKLSKKYGPGVEVRVVKVTAQVRMRKDRGENFYAPQFAAFKSKSHGATHDLPEPSEEVVWSSAIALARKGGEA